MKCKKVIASVAIMLALIASTPTVFAATVKESANDDSNNLILLEKNFETGTMEEVVVENDGRKIDNTPYMPPSVIENSEVVPFDIIGSDTRYELSSYIPAICFVECTYSNNKQGYGTAFIVGSHTLVTAGHLIDDPINGYAKSITVYPARKILNSPYGSYTTTKGAVPKKWSDSVDNATDPSKWQEYANDYDYGIITVNTDICSIVGGAKFGYKANSDSNLNGKSVTITGYPYSDKGVKQFTQKDTIRYVYPKKLFVAIDATAGQSGSPIYSTGYWAEGIYTMGLAKDSNDLEKSYNSGVRFTQEVCNSVDLYNKD